MSAEAEQVQLEAMLSLLRQQGGRVTPARRAVLATLLSTRAHVSAEDLAGEVQKRHPDIHLSTIYRTLEAFERLGVVTHVHLGHGRAAYHLTDQLHHHAVCERCGTVIELPGGIFTDLDELMRTRYGFRAQTHHFAIVGRCAACEAKPTARRPGRARTSGTFA